MVSAMMPPPRAKPPAPAAMALTLMVGLLRAFTDTVPDAVTDDAPI